MVVLFSYFLTVLKLNKVFLRLLEQPCLLDCGLQQKQVYPRCWNYWETGKDYVEHSICDALLFQRWLILSGISVVEELYFILPNL